MSPLEQVLDDLRRSIARVGDGDGIDLSSIEEKLGSIDSELELHRDLHHDRTIPALERIAEALETIAKGGIQLNIGVSK